MASASKISKVQVPASGKGARKWGTQGDAKGKTPTLSRTASSRNGAARGSEPGRFGVYGGRYVPETLMAALEELEREYEKARKDPKFQKRLDTLLRTFAGRPTPLFFAERLTEKL